MALHFLWGLIVLCYGTLYLTTPQAYIHMLLTSTFSTGVVYITVSLLALYAEYAWYKQYFVISLLFLCPQQLLMLLSGSSSINAALKGEYANGVVLPHMFILSDQLPIVIAAIVHTLAMLDRYSGWKTGHSWQEQQ